MTEKPFLQDPLPLIFNGFGNITLNMISCPQDTIWPNQHVITYTDNATVAWADEDIKVYTQTLPDP
jgi:hypothetical protein